MNDVNNEKKTSDCPDHSSLDAAFAEILKSYGHGNARASEDTHDA